MKNIIFSLSVLCLLISCKENKQPVERRYPGMASLEFKGDPHLVEMLNYIIDSSGNLVPDSVHSELGEWKEGYLRSYTEVDSGKKNKVIASYSYFENGMDRSMGINLNGKLIDSGESIINAKGELIAINHYDSTGKISYFSTHKPPNECDESTSGKFYRPDSSLLYEYVKSFQEGINVKFISIDSSGKMDYSYTAELDGDNNVIEAIHATITKDSVKTFIKKYSYKDYDHLKNWQHRTELNARGVPIKVTKRKITYATKLAI
ncbi:hypothetical protein [Flavitalea sp.]|nr:hypothetical protein [Flavitalea sp.]